MISPKSIFRRWRFADARRDEVALSRLANDSRPSASPPRADPRPGQSASDLRPLAHSPCRRRFPARAFETATNCCCDVVGADPLIQCERLLDAAYNALLQRPTFAPIADLVTKRGGDRRLMAQLDALAATLPIGIRDSFDARSRSSPVSRRTGRPDPRSIEEMEAQNRLAALVEINRTAGAG